MATNIAAGDISVKPDYRRRVGDSNVAPGDNPGMGNWPTYFREWRRAHGYKQREMPALAGISQSNYSDLESGKIPYSRLHLEALSTLYGCNPWDLLIGPPPTPESEPRFLIDARGVSEEALVSLHRLTDQLRQKA